MKRFAAGFDIGGTKCAAVLAEMPESGGVPRIVGKRRFATAEFPRPEECLAQLCLGLRNLSEEHRIPLPEIGGIGISCGGPLDPEKGVIQSPPNLPGWDDVPAVRIVREATGLPVVLDNDANACALAEWKYGAGRGSSHMIFLTFGTGMGAGLVFGGRLIRGACGLAGECGHIRLAGQGPEGYGKKGSFEGFCSGGGIARLAAARAEEALDRGAGPVWCPDRESLAGLNAKIVAEAAFAGDPDALAIYAECGRRLGQALSILIDLLNPDRIVIGSIFARSESLLRPAMEEVIGQETLPQTRAACRIVPARLGESVGDVAALALADGADRQALS